MNMAEIVPEIDYEPDVLKFKQIWNQMKDIDFQKKAKNKEVSKVGSASSKSKKYNEPKNNNKDNKPKKQTVISEKNVTRNPKADSQQVVEVVTKPSAINVNTHKSQINFVKRDDYVQSANSPTLTVQVDQLKKAVGEKDYELSLLRISNTRNQDRISVLQAQVSKRDDKIRQLEARQKELLMRNNMLTGSDKIFDYGQVQYENYRNDTRRLLKMLQTTSEYQQFSNLALDDNGVRFLNEVNKKNKSFLDTKQKTKLHFCTCNKQFIPESGFWVPQKIYSYGKQFVKERKGEVTQAQLQLLLYDLNKIWREREKRIYNTLNSQKAKEVDKLKRKIANKKAE